MADYLRGIAGLEGALDYHLARQNVLATNVAHVDTPNYRPKDIERTDPLAFNQQLSMAMSRTSENHLYAGGGPELAPGRVIEDLSAGQGADGNYVSLDREASKLAANQLRYDVISAVVSAEIKQLVFAASDAKG